MTQQIINLGTGPNTQTGETILTAFVKVNDNFTELYAALQGNGADNLIGNTITANNFVTTGNIRTGNIAAYGNIATIGNIIASGFFYPNGKSILGTDAINTDLLPLTGNIFSIGSNAYPWAAATIANSITLGGHVLEFNAQNILTVDGIPFRGSYSDANVAAYLPYYGGPITVSNIYINSTDITTDGTHLFVNGSLVAGNYNNSNVAAFLPTYGGQISASNIDLGGYGITTDGNTIYLNGKSIQSNYGDANVRALLPTYSGNLNSINGITASNLTANNASISNVLYLDTSTITAVKNTLYVNGVPITGTYTNLSVAAYLDTYLPAHSGNLNAIDNLNANTANIYQTLYLNGSALTVVNNQLFANGVPITETYSNTNVHSYLPTYTGTLNNLTSVSSNVLVATANLVLDGATLTVVNNQLYSNGIPISGTYSNANVAQYLPIYFGNMNLVNNLTANIVETVKNLVLDSTSEVVGNIIPSLDLTYTLGNTTNRFKSLYVGGNTIYIGNQSISSNATQITLSNAVSTGNGFFGGNVYISGFANVTGDITANNINANTNILAGGKVAVVGTIDADSNITGANLISNGTVSTGTLTVATTATVTGNATVGNLITSGNISGVNTLFANAANLIGNLTAGNLTSAGTLTIGTITANGNITTTGSINSTGGITGGNITSNGYVSTSTLYVASTANIASNLTAGNISTLGNVAAGYFIGNGSLLTGIDATQIRYQLLSNVKVGSDGNITFSTNTNPNTAVFSDQAFTFYRDLFVDGNIVATGSITANGNLILGNAATDTVQFGAEVSSDILPSLTLTYNLGSPANQWKGIYAGTANVTTLTASGNITAGNIATNGSANIGTLTVTNTATISGNLSAGNISTLGNITANSVTATGNISAAYFSGTFVGNIVSNNLLGNTIPLGTPIDQNFVNGAIGTWTSTTSVTDAIDQLNEAMLNIQANTYVKSTSFIATPTSGGAGTLVTLTISSVGNPNHYNVNWGDGGFSNAVTTVTPSYTYTNNALSPFTVSVTAYNNLGYGAGSSASFTRTNYIVIYTADPVMGFGLYRANVGGSSLSGNNLYTNIGQPIYLQNSTTNTTMANVTYTINFGDGTANAGVSSDSQPGGVLGSRYAYTYSNSSGTSQDTVTLTLTSHTTANPASIPRNTTALLKVYNPNISAPDGLSAKTITFTGNTGTGPYLAANFANNTNGAVTITAGNPIARTVANTGTVNTVTMSSYAYNASAGTLSAYVNNSNNGNVSLSISDNSSTYGALVVAGESDYNLLTNAGVSTTFAASTYAPGLYQGFEAYIAANASTLNSGVNNFKLSHSTTGNTNVVEFAKDFLTVTPSIDLTSAHIYESAAGTYRYISGIPYYNTGSPQVTVSGVKIYNWIGQTYSGPVSSVNPFTVNPGTNIESTSGNIIVSQTKTYGNLDGNVTYLSGGVPLANTGTVSSYSIGNQTVNIGGVASTAAVQTLAFVANNVNGTGTSSTYATANIQVFNATPSGFVETAIPCTITDTNGANAAPAIRIVISGASGATPAYSSSTNYYANRVWSGAQTVAGTDEAVVRWNQLKFFNTDLSTGYLPVGPNLATGRSSGYQYFRGAFARTGRNSWNVTITGKISGLKFAVPGTSIDTLPYTTNGWLDATVAYYGSGVAGAFTSGCATSTPVPISTVISGTTYGITLGTGSTSAPGNTGNQVLFSIVLGPTDYITSWSFS